MKAAAKKESSAEVKGRSASVLTLADTYGLGLIAFGRDGADQSEILAHLSPAARKIAKAAGGHAGGTKKSAGKRHVAMKR